MASERIDTLVIGAGQAGLAMSEHLGRRGLSHLVIERKRIAERWRSERWDSLVANGPAWHDRFPNMLFAGVDPDGFAPRGDIVAYFEAYARQIAAPIRCGVEVLSLRRNADGSGFVATTSEGVIEATNVVVATGPFQKPVFPPIIPPDAGVMQIHSSTYQNPSQLPEGGVLVIGAGSSGAQIADELRRAGRPVWLSVGPHDRPPRRYRGRDFVWWLGVLGMWDMESRSPATEHVTIAVSGARGGHTVDFRRLAADGMTLVGMTKSFCDGVLHFTPDLKAHIDQGDANYLAMLDAADAYVEKEGLDLPEEPEARIIGPDPACVTDPLPALDLKKAQIASVIWATGYVLDFGWIKADIFDARGIPRHRKGVSEEPGLYFLGLAWLTRRASPFIWGVWHDADALAGQIAARARGAG
ncbi:flavin-containing monooxygenase [Gluconacetobacter sacchari]|uniref:NAD(P)-binding domain-containing protein n=2 Tax=Gluconacetobacter sacchari TaxID=92759 RepID=A0A7W4NPY5_9PROT|nr:NAD(P)/FAD-dependent oxidoreductase [Gluconacetobacter sacchari]MBB2161937.1 NAD(P)-binding domain-containing protein [Gluconacetobacter sacchari]GBQ25495.1 flavin-containing monooxygenase [Gluconacetobacter sacchari DSM 12717]